MYGFLLIVHFYGTSFTNKYHPLFVYFTICIIFSFYFTSCLHELRHSHISLLIDLGFSAVAIADRVGHESIDITYRYSHLFPSRQIEMAEKLDAENADDTEFEDYEKEE